MNNNKRYSGILLSGCLIGLIIAATLAIWVDPYFHYHYPSELFKYTLDEQRYQNDGIMRHWDYDAVIIGSSMTENFKTSELDELFSTKSIKVPFSGASFKEISDNIHRVLAYNSDIKMIVQAIDYSRFWTSADYLAYAESSYPTYLTNENLLDDVNYLLNKDVFMKSICTVLNLQGNTEDTVTSFDVAYNWNDEYTFGTKAVLESYTRVNASGAETAATEDEILTFQENIEQNLVKTVKENPNIDFYYFLTPYSICYWDEQNQLGTIGKHLCGERLVIEALVEYENVYLFSFTDDFSLTTNLNNYKDVAHYSEDVNSYILQCMEEKTHRLTKENYEDYLSNIDEFYRNYNYESIFN